MRDVHLGRLREEVIIQPKAEGLGQAKRRKYVPGRTASAKPSAEREVQKQKALE